LIISIGSVARRHKLRESVIFALVTIASWLAVTPPHFSTFIF
jgi:hypothetical protein